MTLLLKTSSILRLISELAVSGYRLTTNWRECAPSQSPKDILRSFNRTKQRWEDAEPAISTSIPGEISFIRLDRDILGLMSSEDRYFRLYQLGAAEIVSREGVMPRLWLEHA